MRARKSKSFDTTFGPFWAGKNGENPKKVNPKVFLPLLDLNELMIFEKFGNFMAIFQSKW